MLYSHHPVFKNNHYWISKPFHHIDLFTTKNQMLPLPSLFGYVLIILRYVDVNVRFQPMTSAEWKHLGFALPGSVNLFKKLSPCGLCDA